VILYADASVPLRSLLQDGTQIVDRAALEGAYTSVIFQVEARRTLDRLRLARELSEDTKSAAMVELLKLERALSFVDVTADVIAYAGRPFPAVVRSLDALHLATAALLRDALVPDLVFATHDRQQAIGALALGFEIIGVKV
jgi:predicted nucleic acid-binding protein